MSEKYLLLKRGLYYRPESSGYTGVKAEAGRYTLEEVSQHIGPFSVGDQGLCHMKEKDAPDYAPACNWEYKLRHQVKALTEEVELLKLELQKWKSV